MDSSRRIALIWRWSLVSGVAIALFWAIWWLIAGEVPVVSSIRLTPDLTVNYPYPVSRWFDILNGPLWATIFVLTFTKDKDEGLGAFLGVFLGWVAGLFLVGPKAPAGLTVIIAITAISTGAIYAYREKSAFKSDLLFGLGIGASFFVSFFYGLFPGVVTLFLMMIFLLGGAMNGIAAKFLFSSASLKKVGRFLIAADKVKVE
jgi:hypothetical protein